MFTTEEGGIVITDLKVSDQGKINLRERAVGRHGIEIDDILDMTLYPDGMDKVIFGRRRVGAQHRLHVPDEVLDTTPGLAGSVTDIVIHDVMAGGQ